MSSLNIYREIVSLCGQLARQDPEPPPIRRVRLCRIPHGEKPCTLAAGDVIKVPSRTFTCVARDGRIDVTVRTNEQESRSNRRGYPRIPPVPPGGISARESSLGLPSIRMRGTRLVISARADRDATKRPPMSNGNATSDARASSRLDHSSLGSNERDERREKDRDGPRRASCPMNI